MSATYTIRRKSDASPVAVFFDQANADAAWSAYCATFFRTHQPKRSAYTVRKGLPADHEMFAAKELGKVVQCNPRPHKEVAK